MEPYIFVIFQGVLDTLCPPLDMHMLCNVRQEHGQIQRGGWGPGPHTPGKSLVAIGFLRNTGTDPT